MFKFLKGIPFLRSWPCNCNRCGADVAISLAAKARRNDWWSDLLEGWGCFLESLIFPFVLWASLRPRLVKCRHCGHRQFLRLWDIVDPPLPPAKPEDGGFWFG